jgi:hypothetical protein
MPPLHTENYIGRLMKKVAPGMILSKSGNYLQIYRGTKMSDLIERLTERASSYRSGGPSSEHTAAMLEEAAARLAELEAAAKAPLPDEVAAIATALKKLVTDSLAFSPALAERTLHWKAAALLERMAREIERLNQDLNFQYTRGADKDCRIAELEAERDALRRVWNMTQASEIEAETIERCAAVVQAMADMFKPGPATEEGRMMRDAWLDAVDNIRALAKPPEKEDK